MKERWENLTSREKNLILIGAVLIILTVIYQFWWWSHERVIALSHQLTQSETSIKRFQQAVGALATLRKSHKQREAVTPESLLTAVENAVRDKPVSKSVTQITAVKSGVVRLQINHVSFDDLIKWLSEIQKEQGIYVLQIRVNKTNAQGIVDVDLQLSV